MLYLSSCGCRKPLTQVRALAKGAAPQAIRIVSEIRGLHYMILAFVVCIGDKIFLPKVGSSVCGPGATI